MQRLCSSAHAAPRLRTNPAPAAAQYRRCRPLPAASYIGKEVSELYDAIGEPESVSYASSCLGSGEDGELVYNGFTVYTYKEGDSEVVQNVQ